MEDYLNILAESLDKKIKLLEKIQDYNKCQEEAFSSSKIKLEDFDRAIEEKGNLIEEINRLDAGFESLYQGLAEELKGNRDKYAAQIRLLQEKISRVTEMSVAVQTQEARNKQLIESYFVKQRQGIKEGRTISRAAYNYYRNMNNSNHVPPQFMDSKK